MDQGYVSPTAGRFVRLALFFFAAVFGLVLLSLAFGSSPASADDGGPDDSALIPAAAELVVDAVAPVTQVVAAIPVAGVPVSSSLSTVTDSLAAGDLPAAPAATISEPVGSVLELVADVVDSTVLVLCGDLAPVLDVVPVLVVGAGVGGESGGASTASAISAAGAALSGSALGHWPGGPGPAGNGQEGSSSASVAFTLLPAAALGAAFCVLLLSRRLGLVNSALPVSPVYETDTSPD